MTVHHRIPVPTGPLPAALKSAVDGYTEALKRHDEAARVLAGSFERIQSGRAKDVAEMAEATKHAATYARHHEREAQAAQEEELLAVEASEALVREAEQTLRATVEAHGGAYVKLLDKERMKATKAAESALSSLHAALIALAQADTHAEWAERLAERKSVKLGDPSYATDELLAPIRRKLAPPPEPDDRPDVAVLLGQGAGVGASVSTIDTRMVRGR